MRGNDRQLQNGKYGCRKGQKLNLYCSKCNGTKERKTKQNSNNKLTNIRKPNHSHFQQNLFQKTIEENQKHSVWTKYNRQRCDK